MCVCGATNIISNTRAGIKKLLADASYYLFLHFLPWNPKQQLNIISSGSFIHQHSAFLQPERYDPDPDAGPSQTPHVN